MIIINKREESKIQTRELILKKTKELINKTGVLNLTTAVIAKECNIAHGTLFQHFGNRDILINTVFDEELKRIAQRIKENCNDVSDLNVLLQSYLKVIYDEEAFLCILYRELPFFPEEIQCNVISLEAILRNVFYTSIYEQKNRKIKADEITLRLDAFFSTVIHYLSLKQLYSPDGDVINSKRTDIIKLFNILFEGV